jgi:hypothetical protein
LQRHRQKNKERYYPYPGIVQQMLSLLLSDLCTDNTMSAKKFTSFPKKVHASTLSFGTAGRLAIQFGHATVYRHSFGNRQASDPGKQ